MLKNAQQSCTNCLREQKSQEEQIMFQHLNKILLQFRKSFKRGTTWRKFVTLVIGFMLRANHYGVTSIVSTLRLEPKYYHTLLHFFRSSGYTATWLYEQWIRISKHEVAFLRISERIILLGDHIKISKEGRRMPEIQILHQDSENSGKGEYIEGHTYAQVGAIITKDAISRTLPLMSEQQKSPPRKENSKEPDGDTLVTQMVNLLGKVLNAFNSEDKAIAVLDAYFSKATAFLAAEKIVDEEGNRRLEIITRSRDDSVGFTVPVPRPKGKRGATPKWGTRIVLRSLFEDMSKFTENTLTLYGKSTKIKYLCKDLLWKPLGEQRLVRFVVLESDRGRMILMSSDLTLSPEQIITIYCLRFKIETSFDEQKNDIGSFSYRFWSKSLPKRKRWTKNNQLPQVEHCMRVEDAKRAIESFVCMGASGISTIIAFSHNRQIWNRYPGWIRTLRSTIPSLAVTKETLAQDFPAFLKSYAHLPICSIINERMRIREFLFVDDEDAA